MIALFVLTVLATVTAGFAIAVWDGRIGLREPATRVIHYDTKYDLSAHRRTKPIE
jgi:hypothetical protein